MRRHVKELVYPKPKAVLDKQQMKVVDEAKLLVIISESFDRGTGNNRWASGSTDLPISSVHCLFSAVCAALASTRLRSWLATNIHLGGFSQSVHNSGSGVAFIFVDTLYDDGIHVFPIQLAQG